jgi:hypothetical protein
MKTECSPFRVNGMHGLRDIALSLLSVINRQGIAKRRVPFREDEETGLEKIRSRSSIVHRSSLDWMKELALARSSSSSHYATEEFV